MIKAKSISNAYFRLQAHSLHCVFDLFMFLYKNDQNKSH